jgi:hypothetical protein
MKKYLKSLKLMNYRLMWLKKTESLGLDCCRGTPKNKIFYQRSPFPPPDYPRTVPLIIPGQSPLIRGKPEESMFI